MSDNGGVIIIIIIIKHLLDAIDDIVISWRHVINNKIGIQKKCERKSS